MMQNKSWKTTAAGGVAALGVFLKDQKDPAWLGVVGEVLAIVGSFAVGLFARDNNKSSEQVGAIKNETTK